MCTVTSLGYAPGRSESQNKGAYAPLKHVPGSKEWFTLVHIRKSEKLKLCYSRKKWNLPESVDRVLNYDNE